MTHFTSALHLLREVVCFGKAQEADLVSGYRSTRPGIPALSADSYRELT